MVNITGAFAIITNEKNEVLLCHRNDYDLRNLPGGKVELGEAPRDAVIREVKEETGLNGRIKELSGIYYKPEKDELVFQFVCEIISGEITLNEEANDIKYFDRRKLPVNTLDKQVERINDYFDKEETIVFKKQFGPSSVDKLKKNS